MPLPSYPSKGDPINNPPIIIFSKSIRRASRLLKFISWYKIDRVQLLEPEELVRTLMKKLETVNKYGHVVERKRGASIWVESLSYKWVVVEMEKDQEAVRNKSEPDIERGV